MAQIPEIPAQVSVIIRAEENVESFVRRALGIAARQAGLPLTEQNLFVDALIAQYPSSTRMIWLRDDPTPRTTSEVRTEDFNFLLFLEYLREHPGAGKRKVSIKQVKAFEGRVLQPFPIDEITRAELAKWQQDFIYRGGELGTGRPAPISRQGLVPSLQVLAEEPDITWIPQIMRSKGWNEGAMLMEAWVSRAAKVRTTPIETTPDDFGPPVYDIIRMDWLLNFGRARKVYDDMINGQIWKNDAAKNLIKEKFLGRLRSSPGQRMGFGELNSVRIAANHRNYIQSRVVLQPLTEARDNPDGLTASLANFQFFMTFNGSLAIVEKGIEVRMEKVGVYMRDSYDFINDEKWSNFRLSCLCYDQSLGGSDMWGKEIGEVTNNSFNKWRETNQKGGDYLVYSDIKTTNLNVASNTFIIPF